MRDLFRANPRRDLTTAGVLLTFATMAMAAAHWGTLSPGEPASLTGEQEVAFVGDVDHRLPSSSPDLAPVPMFTTGGSPVADGALPADPVLPPPAAAAAAAAPVAGGFGTSSAAGSGWHSPGGFGSGDRSSLLRGASSASGIGSMAGMSGGGAWGGVSGTATKTNETIVAGASAKVVNGSAQRTGTSSARTSQAANASLKAAAPAVFSEAAGPIAPAATVFTPGTLESLKDPALAALPDRPSDSPSSAPTPEPLSFILVGVGLAGIYGLRKHLR